MPYPPKPTDHIDWTDGSSLKVTEPTSGKKLLGWTLGERPAFQFMNWLFWQVNNWQVYFEQVTDINIADIAALQTTVAGLGFAYNVQASNTGHTTLTGLNVQAQLDETDAALTALYNAITSGMGIDLVGYVPAAPANWTPPPTHAGPALDQLAFRVKSLEAGFATTTYTDENFADYCIPADDPVHGAGNQGLTSNGSVNPRGISLADMKMYYGEERLYIREVRQTGNYDANGLKEYSATSPRNDIRIMLYGEWQLSAWNDGQPCSVVCQTNGGYITVTGVFDGMGLIYRADWTGNSTNEVDISVDGTPTGNSLMLRTFSDVSVNAGPDFRVVSHFSMQNLTQDIHTVKLTNNSTDAGLLFEVFGVVIMNTQPVEMAGNMYLDKVLTNFNKQTVSAPSVNNKGGKIIRYVDRTDSTRKDSVMNVATVQTTSPSIGSGATTLSVASSAGFVAGDIILIRDSATNSELQVVNSVGPGTLALVGSGTTNNYTSADIIMYGKSLNACDHSNEQENRRFWPTTWGYTGYNYLGASILNYIATSTGNFPLEDGGHNLYFSASYKALNVETPINTSRMMQNDGNTSDFNGFEFFGTGFDVVIGNASGTSGGRALIYIDGVFVGKLTMTKDLTKRYKIVSDLPMGHHVVHFVADTTPTSAYYYGFLASIVYMPKDSNTITSLAEGDKLNERYKLADYQFCGNGLYKVSKGVTRCQVATRDAVFGNDTGTGYGSGGWSTVYDLGYNTFYQRSNGSLGDYMIKQFYGTGVDLTFYGGNNRGIVHAFIDGNPVTTANFPTAVLQGQGFNPSTGEIDAYSASPLYGARVSFANISATPQWHTVKIRHFNTKNPSSAGYYFDIACVDTHGAVQVSDLVTGENALQSAIIGGVKDLRLTDALGMDQLMRKSYSGTYGQYINLSTPLNYFVAAEGCFQDFYLPYDADVQFTATAVEYSSPSHEFDWQLVVDGYAEPMSSTVDIAVSFGQAVYTKTVRLSKGWHSWYLEVTANGSMELYYSDRNGSVKVLNYYKT